MGQARGDAALRSPGEPVSWGRGRRGPAVARWPTACSRRQSPSRPPGIPRSSASGTPLRPSLCPSPQMRSWSERGQPGRPSAGLDLVPEAGRVRVTSAPASWCPGRSSGSGWALWALRRLPLGRADVLPASSLRSVPSAFSPHGASHAACFRRFYLEIVTDSGSRRRGTEKHICHLASPAGDIL